MAFRSVTHTATSTQPMQLPDALQRQARPVAQALAAVGLALPLGMSWAASIVVNSALDSSGTPGVCTLRDAILSANNDAAIAGCTAGAGADLITFSLASGTVISLSTPLPEIDHELSINGVGVVVERSPAAQVVSDFRIMAAVGRVGRFPFALSDITLRGGLSLSQGLGGAGLRANTLSSVTLTNVTLGGTVANAASLAAGAEISAVSGDVMLDRVVAQNNVATQFGAGGVYIHDVGGAVTIRESSFRGNLANINDVDGGGGGARIERVGGIVNIARTEFVTNTAREGGGLMLRELTAPAEIRNTYIGNNLSTVSNALNAVDCNTVSIVQSWIADNQRNPASTETPTGVRIVNTANVRVVDTTIGPGTGGALVVGQAAQLELENTTLTGFLVGNAMAGVYVVASEESPTAISIRNSTITNNGYGVTTNFPATIVVDNSIISGNTVRDVTPNANVVASFSMLGTTTAFAGPGNISSDTPGLNPVSAAFNPGRTAGPTSNTRLIPVHRPLQNSLAIDAGDPDFAGSPAQDQVGNARVRRGSSGNLRLDMGAVEALVPRVTIGDASALEGTASSNNVLFTVSISDLPDPGLPVSVDYRTLDDTAVGGSDYVARSGSIAFSNAGNVMSQILSVPTIPDAVVEPDETFRMMLNNVSNALFAPAANVVTEVFAIGSIINDDSATLSVNNASTVEGGNVVFSVTLSQSSAAPISVNYATAPGTATSGADYAPASGVLTFAPGETSKQVAVSTIDDLIVEGTETFTLNLSNAISATILTASGTGTIFDNDTANTITVVSFGPTTTIYEPAGNCAVTLGVQGVVGLGAGTLVLPNPMVPPPGQTMPYGMQQTELFTCPGGSVNVTVTWPGAFESHWKWGATAAQPTPHWYAFSATPMGPNTVRFTLTDGGFGDNDLAANGRIVDPYAAAVAAPVPPVPVGGWWTGVAAAISGLLGALGLRGLRRRRP